MEGNVWDENQQRMAKKSKQLLLRAESLWRGGMAGEGRGGGWWGAGRVSAYGTGTKGACWNVCPPKDDGDCEVEEEEEDCYVASLLHIWSISEFWIQA